MSKTRDDIREVIDNADLGALAERGEPIGDCLDAMWLLWSGADRDIEVDDRLGDNLETALDTLNAHYDDGYEIDAPAAHDAKWDVCAAFDDITDALRAEQRRRDDEPGDRPASEVLGP